MAIQYLKNNFSRGELTPLMIARSDTEVYNVGAKQLKNMPVMSYGGCSRRSGSRYIAEVKDSSSYTWLLPFIFSETDAQILELGDEYIRFFKDGAQVETAPTFPYELVSPYEGTKEVLSRIKTAQKGDNIYMSHGDYVPKKLTRSGLTSWLFDVAFMTSGAPVPLSPQVAFGKFNALSTGSPGQYRITPAASGSADWKDNVNGGLGFLASDTTDSKMLYLQAADGNYYYYRVGTFTNDSSVLVVRISEPDSVTFSANNLSGGTVFGDNRDLSEVFQESAFCVTYGYPKATTIFENRLFFAGTDALPQAIWGSEIGLFDSFKIGSLDTDSIFFNLSFEHNNPIQWLSNGSALYIGTQGEVTGITGVDGIFSATSFNRLRGSYNGGNFLQPVKLESVSYFSGKQGVRLFSFGYSNDIGGLKTTETSILSEHLFSSGLIQMAKAETGVSIIWATGNDGKLISTTINTDQQVIAPQSNSFGGEFNSGDSLCDSVAVVPSADGDRVYQIVKRTINGSTKRYVEIMETPFDISEGKETAWFVDSGLQYNGASTSILTGLDHLEGQTVTVYADGGSQATKVVSSGQITLDTPASFVTVGLSYSDSSILEIMPIDGINQNGTSLTQPKSITGFFVNVFNSATFQYSTDGKIWHDILNMQNDVVFDEGQSLKSGWIDMFADSSFQGFNFNDENARMMFRPKGALPLTILGTVIKLGG